MSGEYSCSAPQRYWPNLNGSECFRSALANALEALGNSWSAMTVYSRYYEHPLVREDGKMHPRTARRIMHDLTDGAYTGVMYSAFSLDQQTVGMAVEDFGHERGNAIIDAVREEQDSGFLILGERDITINCPSVCITNSHCYVMLGDNLVVDNGFLFRKETANESVKLYGVLTKIRRTRRGE